MTIMMVVSNGFTAGAAIAGLVAAWMLPRFGWRSVFYTGGVMPLMGKLGEWLRKIDPSVT